MTMGEEIRSALPVFRSVISGLGWLETGITFMGSWNGRGMISYTRGLGERERQDINWRYGLSHHGTASTVSR
jgi:hypothetical protein